RISKVHLNISRGIRTWRVISKLLRIHWALMIDYLNDPDHYYIRYKSAKALMKWAVIQLTNQSITPTLDLADQKAVDMLISRIDKLVLLSPPSDNKTQWLNCSRSNMYI